MKNILLLFEVTKKKCMIIDVIVFLSRYYELNLELTFLVLRLTIIFTDYFFASRDDIMYSIVAGVGGGVLVFFYSAECFFFFLDLELP